MKKETLAAKLAQIGKEAGNINKEVHGGVKYAYRKYDDILGALRSSLAKHGVSIVPRTTSSEITRFPAPNQYNKDRQGVQAVVEIEYLVTDGEDTIRGAFSGMSVDYGDKALTQACSMAHKYFLIQLFGLAGVIEDPDSQNTEATIPQAQPIRKPDPVKIPEAAFSFDLLEKMKWDGKALPNGNIILTGKAGKQEVELSEAQKTVCNLFIERKQKAA